MKRKAETNDLRHQHNVHRCWSWSAGALEVPMSTHSRQQSLEYNQHIFHPELLHCNPTWESASGFRCRQEPSETAVASFACDIATCLHACPGLHPETIQFNWKEAVRLNSIHLPHTHTHRKLIRFRACFIFFERFFDSKTWGTEKFSHCGLCT